MIRLKGSGELLQKPDIEELIAEFDKWLKREKKISSYPNASYDREKRGKKLEEIIKAVHNPTIRRIADELAIRLQSANDYEIEYLQDIREFFE